MAYSSTRSPETPGLDLRATFRKHIYFMSVEAVLSDVRFPSHLLDAPAIIQSSAGKSLCERGTERTWPVGSPSTNRGGTSGRNEKEGQSRKDREERQRELDS